jgi:hypothetical protein
MRVNDSGQGRAIMTKSAKIPPVSKQLKYAKPFGDLITTELDRILKETPEKDRGIALFAMTKVMTIIWVNIMRDIEMDPLQAIIMMTDIWKSVEQTDEMLDENDRIGGLH